MNKMPFAISLAALTAFLFFGTAEARQQGEDTREARLCAGEAGNSGCVSCSKDIQSERSAPKVIRGRAGEPILIR